MTDEDDAMWPPALWAKQFQEASEQAVEQQTEFAKQLMNAGSSPGSLSEMAAASMGTATFKTRVQSGGRISIPDAEREALDIEEGDIVQTVVVPVKRDRDQS
jgi:DNA-binding transcriptional regulator/RsmH inhibitor MraZ